MIIIKRIKKKLIKLANFSHSLNTITTKLLMLILFIIIIPLIVLAQFSTDLINTNMTEKAKSQLALNIKIIQKEFKDSKEEIQKVTEIALINYKNKNTLYELRSSANKNDLKEVVRKSGLDFIYIIDKNRNILASNMEDDSIKKLNSFEKLVDKAIYTGQTITSIDILDSQDINFSNIRIKKLTYIKSLSNNQTYRAGLSDVSVIPIYNKNQELLAVAISGQLLAKTFNKADSIGNLTNSSIMIAQILKNGDFFVISSNIKNIRGKETIGLNIPALTLKYLFKIESNQEQKPLLNNKLESFLPLRSIDGNILGLIYIGMPEEQFTSLARQNVKLIGSISVVGLFVAIFLSAIFARSITSPIIKLADAVKKISLGDLSARVNVKGSYEISQMGESFNLMAKNIYREQRLRDDFVATLTHDLKVPLLAENQTINYMLKGIYGQINEEQKEVLDVIKTTNDATLDMIKILLEVYRYEEGKITLLESLVNVDELIKNSLVPLKSLLEEKKLTVNFDQSDLSVMIKVDERELKRVLHNILANAIYSTPKRGQITIKVKKYLNTSSYYISDKEFEFSTLKEDLLLEKCVLISIYDTGIGIESEDISNLFKRFSSNKGRKPSSTGLGLYNSYQVIKAHHGYIWAETEEGKGSVFKFTLPLDDHKNV